MNKQNSAQKKLKSEKEASLVSSYRIGDVLQRSTIVAGIAKFFVCLLFFCLCWVFVSVRGLSLVVASGATLHRGAWAFHCRGLSCCGAQAPDAQAQ